MKESNSRKSPGYSGFKYKYFASKGRASRAGISFAITFEQFMQIVVQNCAYCGAVPRSFNMFLNADGTRNKKGLLIKDEWVQKSYINLNGIDRSDNSIGYMFSNCVPCCEQCNLSKLDYSAQEFLSHARRIVEHQSVASS